MKLDKLKDEYQKLTEQVRTLEKRRAPIRWQLICAAVHDEWPEATHAQLVADEWDNGWFYEISELLDTDGDVIDNGIWFEDDTVRSALADFSAWYGAHEHREIRLDLNT